MLIGELSAETGVSKDTIRFYEKIGLLRAGERQAGSRTYKEFSPATIGRLKLILLAKKLGFRLSEMRQTLDDWENGKLSIAEKQQIIRQKMTDIDMQVEQLEEMKSYLANKLSFLQQKDL